MTEYTDPVTEVRDKRGDMVIISIHQQWAPGYARFTVVCVSEMYLCNRHAESLLEEWWRNRNEAERTTMAEQQQDSDVRSDSERSQESTSRDDQEESSRTMPSNSAQVSRPMPTKPPGVPGSNPPQSAGGGAARGRPRSNDPKVTERRWKAVRARFEYVPDNPIVTREERLNAARLIADRLGVWYKFRKSRGGPARMTTHPDDKDLLNPDDPKHQQK